MGYLKFAPRAKNRLLMQTEKSCLRANAGYIPVQQCMELDYTGAIDDNAKSADEVDETYMEDAIHNLIAGKEISPEKTKALGCTIKWPE